MRQRIGWHLVACLLSKHCKAGRHLYSLMCDPADRCLRCNRKAQQ